MPVLWHFVHRHKLRLTAMTAKQIILVQIFNRYSIIVEIYNSKKYNDRVYLNVHKAVGPRPLHSKI